MSQFALPLDLDTGAPGEFIVGPANAEVVDLLKRWDRWPNGVAILIGPGRSGKTNMGIGFQRQSGGLFQDEADQVEDEALFHLWNRAKNEGQPLLLASRLPVGEWHVALPDLRSRLGASLPIVLTPPDDAMIEALLRNFFARRGGAITNDALEYLNKRVRRSYAFVETLAEYMDRESRERKKPVNLAVARAALDLMGASEEESSDE